MISRSSGNKTRDVERARGAPTPRRRNRRAFTLIELLLVIALMVMIAAIAWPAIKGPFDTQRLAKSAELLRAEFGKTRVRAMRTGVIQVFRFQPGQSGYGSETWTASVEDVAATPPAGGGFGAPTEAVVPSSRTDSLPEGVMFHLAEVTVDARAAKLLGPAGGEAGSAAEWSDPIFFYPDGTTSNTHVVLSNARGQAIIVTLRGLTGLTLPSEITTIEQLSR